MSHSEQINELSTALAKAQGAMKAATFNKVNPHFKSKYADLAAVWEAIRDPLSKNGLSVTQTMESNGNGELWMHTILHHSSGQWIGSDYPLPVGVKPQEFGSALTYARRYSLAAIVGIASDEDDDANAAQKVEAPKIASAAPPPLPLPIIGGEPREIVLGDSPDWVWFGQQMIAAASTPQSSDWVKANHNNLGRMANEAPKVHDRMIAAIKKAQP